ncbi:MAG: hypothetical protein M3N98_01030, partial [Actinomycetota bacterium]|nr:hypothetical protein [Actinomycetota bacterium]
MDPRQVDASRFAVEAVVVDWRRVAARQGNDSALAAVANVKPVVQLRWSLGAREQKNTTDCRIGMPTEPFRVWRRPHATDQKTVRPFPFQSVAFGDVRIVSWSQPLVQVTLDVQADAPGIQILGFGGPPLLERVVTPVVNVGAGTQSVDLSGSALDGVLIAGSLAGVTAVRGVTTDDFGLATDWELVEIVGLPVDRAQWGDVADLAAPQGLKAAVGDPRQAAVERLVRGGPPLGWWSFLAAGTPAPPWQAPDPTKLVEEVNLELLPRLHDVLQLPPNLQAGAKTTVAIDPPVNGAGTAMPASGSAATIAPLGVLLAATGTDPFLSLALGFGTALEDLGNVDRRFDYMVTARFAQGLDNASPAVEYAAYALDPQPAVPPLPPATMSADAIGLSRPSRPDDAWTAAVKVGWDRIPPIGLLRVGSFGFARVDPATPTAAELLLERRLSGGHRPIAANSNPGAANPHRVEASDKSLPIPADPGVQAQRYAAATQDIFGQWSPWTLADTSVAQPPAQPPRLLSAELRAVAPASGHVATGTLVVDVALDWMVRRPANIRLVGVLYPEATRGGQPGG